MAILSRTLLNSSAIAILSTLPASAHPSQQPDSLTKRQGTGGALIAIFAPTQLNGAIFGEDPQCCDNSSEQCVVCQQDGGTWQACWDQPPQGVGYYWTQDDTNTANCLINLHYTQKDVCISVAGSECEAGKGTSHILNAYGNGDQLSSDDSDTLQTASSNMVGMTVSSGYSDNSGLSMGVVRLARIGQNFADVILDIRFDGDEAC